MAIVKINNKKDEKFLRQKTVVFDFEKFTKKEINELIQKMRKEMREANGIGLSANQIGYSFKIFVAQVPDENGSQKFYAVFNPEIKKASREVLDLDEGCLSVPGIYGLVKRPEKIVLRGFDKNGKKIKIKAWGLLARVFQHETDHLNGMLFIDKAQNLRSLEEKE